MPLQIKIQGPASGQSYPLLQKMQENTLRHRITVLKDEMREYEASGYMSARLA